MCNHVQPAVSTGSCQQVCSRIHDHAPVRGGTVLQWCGHQPHYRHELSHHSHLPQVPTTILLSTTTYPTVLGMHTHKVAESSILFRVTLLSLSFRTRMPETSFPSMHPPFLGNPSFAPPSATAADKHASTRYIRSDADESQPPVAA
jgi:hypothetical protein